MWVIADASSNKNFFHAQNGMLSGPGAVLLIRDRAIKTEVSLKLRASWLVCNSDSVGST